MSFQSELIITINIFFKKGKGTGYTQFVPLDCPCGWHASTTESGGIRGFDAGKKINGRKRHVVVDTFGLMVGLVIHSAGIQDRDGAPDVLKTILKR